MGRAVGNGCRFQAQVRVEDEIARKEDWDRDCEDEGRRGHTEKEKRRQRLKQKEALLQRGG